MAAPPLMRTLSTRTVKKLEKPRPLKISASQSKIVPSEPSPRISLPFQDIMVLVESVSHSLADLSMNCDEVLVSNITTMHSKLKVHGQQLEAVFKDQLDRAFVIFRDGCKNDSLPCTTRLHLLELVELRANQWSNCDNTQIYYSAKMTTPEVEPIPAAQDVNTNSIPVPTSIPSPPSTPVLGPGEVLKTSGKFPKPTKIPGKSYCKDEVVIRNSDSGKVMGIKGRRVHMIEEISETIISFQRDFMRPLIIKSPVMWNGARYLYPSQFFRPGNIPPSSLWNPSPGYFSPSPLWRPHSATLVNPGAKERLVQITGPSEDKIVHARHLMEDTIRRNASPVREMVEEKMGGSSSSLNSSASEENGRYVLTNAGSKGKVLLHSYSTNDASLGEYKYTVTLGNDTVKITGSNHETVRNARLVLEEYYNIWLQKNCFGDTYGYDDVFLDPMQVEMLRMNSLDSGNGNGPSNSSGDSDDITCISSLPTAGLGPTASAAPPQGLDPGFGYLSTPPAPDSPILYPEATQPERRPLLGRSDPTPAALSETLPQAAVSRKYSREFLLECTLSHYSRATPPNWDQISQEYPAIIKKVPLLDDPPFNPYAPPYAYSNAWTYVNPYAFPN